MFTKILKIFNTAIETLENSSPKTDQHLTVNNNTQEKEYTFKKQAFETVMRQTDIPLKKQEEIFAIWQPFEDIKKFYLQFTEILPQNDWKWYEFAKWKEIFTKDNIYPYMWKQYPEIYMNAVEEYPFINNFNSYSGTYMKVGELKELLNQLNIEIPQKSKRDDLIKLIEDNVTYELLKEKLPDLYEKQKSNFEKRQYQGKIAIFEHYLNSMYVKYRDWDNCLLERFEYVKELSGKGAGCPIEDKIGAEKEKEKITFENSPPFFPGDRLIAIYRKKK